MSSANELPCAPPSSARVRAARRRRRPASNVFILNLTPLLDCVFLLLLFLIVATRFADPEGLLAARLPARITAALGMEVPRTPIRLVLTATRDGRSEARFGDKTQPSLARERLAAEFARLRQLPGYDEQTPVYLTAEDAVSWDDVVNAYNAALTSSFRRVFFVRP